MGLAFALLFPCLLVLSELILRLTHHRPLGAVALAIGAVGLTFPIGGFVSGLSESGRARGERDSLSQIETDDGPVISGVVARRSERGRERWLAGFAIALWAIALSWVFFT